MALVTCQACGRLTGEGAFCEKCGAPPVPVSSPPPEPEARVIPQEHRTVSIGEAPTSRVVMISAEAPPACAFSVAPPAPRAASVAAAADDFDDCPELRVERDTVGFCVAGSNALLRLRLTPQVEGLSELRVNLCLPCVTGAAVPSVQWYRPKAGKPCEFSLTIPPLKQGPYAAELTLQFVKNGKVQKFSANTELYVYPSESSAAAIAHNIVVNINNDIKMGHASDLHQSLDAASVLGRFENNGQAHGVSELLDLLKTDLRSYRQVCFNESGECGPSRPPAEALADRVTLSVGGRMLHLIAGSRVTLGRNRSNRICTRLFGRDVAETSLRNSRISKFHCTVELDGDGCAVHDGARDESGNMRPSACGVSWQGIAVRGAVRFPAGSFPQSATLGLAGSPGAPDIGLTAQGCFFNPSRCETCGDHAGRLCHRGRIPAVVLRRTDEAPESYALLWACLDLGRVFPECAGLIVCHEQGAFSWRSAGTFGWITPGRFASGGVEIAVREFAQYGL